MLTFLFGCRLFQCPKPEVEAWFDIVCDCRDVLWLCIVAVLLSLLEWPGVWEVKKAGA